MMKHIVTQLSMEDANPHMVAFAKEALVAVQTQSNLAHQLYDNKSVIPQRPQRPAD